LYYIISKSNECISVVLNCVIWLSTTHGMKNIKFLIKFGLYAVPYIFGFFKARIMELRTDPLYLSDICCTKQEIYNSLRHNNLSLALLIPPYMVTYLSSHLPHWRKAGGTYPAYTDNRKCCQWFNRIMSIPLCITAAGTVSQQLALDITGHVRRETNTKHGKLSASLQWKRRRVEEETTWVSKEL
jgi:hypothetical protein